MNHSKEVNMEAIIMAIFTACAMSPFGLFVTLKVLKHRRPCGEGR